ncbi:MAG: hypothetical protein ACN6N0_08000 [Microvirgula sp.]
MLAGSAAAGLAARLPASLQIAVADSIERAPVQAALYDDDEVAASLRPALAGRDGEIVGLNRVRDNGRYDVFRLVHERAVSRTRAIPWSMTIR